MGSSSKKQTVGYRYSFDIHFAIGKAMDEMLKIRASGKMAWIGSVTENQRIRINAPNLFGGDKGEGGIQGWLDVMFGDEDQAVNSRLASVLGGLVPAFRGFCGGFFSGLVTSNNPYPKAWEILRWRALKGWDGPVWYPETCVIALAGGAIRSMNAAHILYETYTNRDWGRGLDRSVMDDAAWRAAALRLYEEGFGLCLEWKASTPLSEFRDQVANHIGAYVGPDRRTGLISITLIRDDYDASEVPLFDEDSGLLGVDEDEASSALIAPSQLVVEYVDAISGETRRARAVNSAIAQAQGGPSVETISYPGLPTAELAGRVAGRDMRIKGSNLRKFRVRLDRRGWQLAPGSVFRVRSLKRGIETIVLRAGRIEDGTLSSGVITITALQDVFGLPASSFVSIPPSGYVPPDTTPAAIALRQLMEVPYRDLAGRYDPANLALLDTTSSWIACLARQPAGLALNYTITSRPAAGDFIERADGQWCPSALLAGELRGDEIVETVATVTDPDDLEEIEVGMAAVLGTELVRVDAVDVVSGELTLGRGCVDTIPATHPAGARIWFYDGFAGEEGVEYSAGVTIETKLLTNTSSGQLDPDLAGVDSIALQGRQGRPYPPGNLIINGERSPGAIDGLLSITWSHRDRIIQADQLVDWSMGNIGPEPGTTYTVLVRDPTDSTVLHEASGITGDSYEVEFEHSAGVVELIVTSMRDDLSCWQSPSCQFDYTGEAPELLLAMEGGEPFLTEAGEPMAFEADSYGVYSAPGGSVKFSELLPAPDALSGEELVPVVQSGVNYSITTERLRDFVAAAIPAGLSAYQVAVINGFSGTAVEWLASLTGPAGGPTQVRSAAGTSYTISEVDNGAWLECTAGTVRLPETIEAGFEVGDIVEIRQAGATAVSFVADTGEVAMSFDVGAFQPLTRYQGGVVAAKVISTNTWALVGALADA